MRCCLICVDFPGSLVHITASSHLSKEHTGQDVALQMNVFIFQRQPVLLVPPPPFSDVFFWRRRGWFLCLSSFLTGDGSVAEDFRKHMKLEWETWDSLCLYFLTYQLLRHSTIPSSLSSLSSVCRMEVFLGRVVETQLLFWHRCHFKRTLSASFSSFSWRGNE